MKKALRAATERYREWSPLYYYARGKTLLDPAYPAVLEMLGESERPLLDLGCGMGLLAACLRENGHRGRITGLDIDAEKIAVARRVLGKENAEFLAENAGNFPAHAGDVVMLDALHYFDDEAQQALLERIAQSVSEDGVALIRTTPAEKSWRYTMTRLEEWVVRVSKWIPEYGWNFPTREEVTEPFHRAGFHTECHPMWGWTPFNSHMFVFRRGAQVW